MAVPIQRGETMQPPILAGQRGLTGVEKLRRLKEAYGHLAAADLLAAVAAEFPGRIAVASSFGSESAVMLALVAQVDKAMPILFLETGMLFPETLAYVDSLAALLGLTAIRRLRPDEALRRQADPEGELWISDPDKCCYVRKVHPFRVALRGYDCWVSGLKRAHGGARGDVEAIELEEGQIKLNPLWNWSGEDIERAFVDWDLPCHPLVGRGYRSIGCVPCTRISRPGEGARDGRWDGRGKTECGIHANQYGKSLGEV